MATPILITRMHELQCKQIELDMLGESLDPKDYYELRILESLEETWDDDADIQNIIYACSNIITNCIKTIHQKP